ncbi:MAG: hypothetical protein ACI86M_000877 [Saprospiraceae bacterium]|jgi:hypothetical protein
MLSKMLLMLVFGFIAFASNSQDVLLYENFDDCSLPSGWDLEVTNDQNAGVTFDYMYNEKSDSLTIDGSCMVIFDDDILGNNMPSFVAELRSPMLDVAEYSSINFSVDAAFRAYGTSSLEFFVIANEEYISIARYSEENSTGSSFSQAINFRADLSFLVDADKIQLAIVYDDDNMYAWYAGIDNIMVIGEDKGEAVVQENFNSCEIPAGWESEILRGEEAWVFGLVENGNTSSNSMNGSCFAYFDDDGIGQDVPFSTVELRTPIFDGSAFAEYVLDFDLIFRKAVDFENISVYIFDGTNYYLVKEFIEEVGGVQFNNFESLSLDLTEYRAAQMQVAFRYEDGDAWGWWVGIDNVKISGKGDINDICSKAEELIVNQQCTPVSNRVAVSTGPDASCGEKIEHTLWYSFKAERSGILEITNSADYNDIVSIYAGTCDTLSELDCVNKDEHGFQGERVLLELTEGENIIIRIASIVGKYGALSGVSCLGAQWLEMMPFPAEYDMIGSAMPITVGEDCTPISNDRATMSLSLPVANELARADVWLTYECMQSGNYLIETNTDFSESIVLFELIDSVLQEVVFNHFGQSVILPNAEEGRQYVIQVSGLFSTVEGVACVKISQETEVDVEANECADPIDIEIGQIVDINNEANTFSGIYPSCNVYSGKDIWLRFQSVSTSIYIGTDTGFPAAIAIYEGLCDELEEVWCSENKIICEGYLHVTGLQPNEEYLIQIVSDYTFDELKGGNMAIKLIESIEDEPEPLGILVNEICQDGSMAVLEVLVYGGSGDYEIIGNQSGDTLFAGEEYLVVVNDIDGCEVTKQGVIGCQSSSCDLIANSTIGNLQCYNGQDGYIIVGLENASEPTTYQWGDESLIGQNPINLDVGLYSVTITDADQCVMIKEFILSQPDALLAELIINDESGPIANDGSVEIIGTGGVFPYSYIWEDGSTEATIDSLMPNNYSVTITDALGCTKVSEITISAFDCNFDISSAIISLTCFDSEDGNIGLTSNNEVEIQNVSWSNGSNGITLENLSQGEYTATITLKNGCESIEVYTVNGPDIIELVEESNVDVKCNGEANGAISLSAVGGAGDKRFLWPDGMESNSRGDLEAGPYEVIVIDSNECIQVFSIEINEPELLEIASSMSNDPSCHDSEDGMICIFINGGLLPYDFDWGDALPAISKLENLAGGIYPLTVYDLNSCTLTTEVVLNIPDEISVMVVSILVDESNPDKAAIDIDALGGSGVYTFIWSLDGEVVSTEEDPQGIDKGLYSLTITDSNGCEQAIDVLVIPTSIYDLTKISIEVYPNPAMDYTEIIVDQNDFLDLQYKVYSTDGKLMVKTQRLAANRVRIDLESFVSGSYILELVDGDNVRRVPFVKVK